MSTSASQAPSTAKYRSVHDISDVEPDAEWKTALRKRIEDGLGAMVKDAKDHLEAELRKTPVSVEGRERLIIEYSKAMENIRNLAEEEFKLELQREREERRWVAGRGMDPKWNEALKREQQDIMDNIKAQKESSSPKTTEPPDNVMPSVVRTAPPVSIPERPQSPAEPDRQRAERERERELERERDSERDSQSESQSVHKPRRESNTYSSKHRDQISHSLRHASHQPPPDETASHFEPWVSDDMSEEPESLLRPPERRSSADRPSTHEAVNRPMERASRSLAERHTRPSPKHVPEIWKPSISPEEDARMSSPYTLVRRGSTASMRSTGSAGVRPSIAEAIPERTDDAMEPSGRDKGRFHEIEEAWRPPEKMREKERQAPWNDDRHRITRESSPLSDDYSSTASAGLSSSRPLDPKGGPYSTPSSSRPVRRKASLTAEERDYTAGQFPPRLVPRASFTDDRNYPAGPYQAPPPGRPVMRDTTFIYDERDRDRERERDMDRHTDRYASRPYPTPPASANRSAARDYSYTPDNYDTRPDPYYRDHEQHSAAWRAAHIPESPVSIPYRRPSEGRQGLGREASYSRMRNEVSSPEGKFILDAVEVLK